MRNTCSRGNAFATGPRGSPDPAAEEDLRRLAKRLGHEIVEVTHDGDEVTLLIKK